MKMARKMLLHCIPYNHTRESKNNADCLKWVKIHYEDKIYKHAVYIWDSRNKKFPEWAAKCEKKSDGKSQKIKKGQKYV